MRLSEIECRLSMERESRDGSCSRSLEYEERFCWLESVRFKFNHAGLSVRLSIEAVGDELPLSLTSEPGDEARSGLGGPSMLTGRLRAAGLCGGSSSIGAIDSWAG